MQHADHIVVEDLSSTSGGYTLWVSWSSRWAKYTVYKARHISKQHKDHPALLISHNLTKQQRSEVKVFAYIKAQAFAAGHKVELLCFPIVCLRLDSKLYHTSAAAATAIATG